MKTYFEIKENELVSYFGKETNVVIPENITKINEDSFRYLDNLKSVTIGKNVKEISDYAFFECENLEEIILSDSIEIVGVNAFDECQKLNFNIYENGKYLGSEKNPYLLFFSLINKNSSSCEIHPDAKIIYNNAFSNCNNLTKITIPDNIKYIGECAFLGCRNLKSVVFGKGITCISKEIFMHCFYLESVTLLGDVEKISEFAFKNCTRLKEINIPESLRIIENCAFFSCEGLKVFYLPKSIQEIGVNVFMHCKDVELHYFGEDIKEVFSDENVTKIFAPNISLKIIKKNRQKFIFGYINNFKNSKSLNEIVLSEYVKYIKTNKTRYYENIDENICSFMTENDILNLDDIDFLIEKTTEKNQVELTASLLEYKNNKFSYNQIEKQFEKNLFNEKKVTISSLTPLWDFKKLENGNYEILGYKGSSSEIEIPYNISNGVVESVTLNGKFTGITQKRAKTVKSVVIPEGVKEIKDRAFDNCPNLSKVVFSSSLTSLGNYAFGFNNKNFSYNIFDNAKYFGSIDNPYFILIEAINETIETCEIHNDTKFIYDSAFQGCENLREIIIPDSVSCIGANAFYGCLELKNIVIGKNVEKIKHKAFGDCSSLKKIEIPEGVREILDFAFCNCTKLSDIIIPESVKEIKEFTFKGCNSLKSIKLPEGLEKIHYAAFEDCLNLKEIRIPNKIKTINMDTFRRCINLSKIELPESLEKIKINAFFECKNLTSIIVPENVKEIGPAAFSDCTSLKSVIFPKNLTKIEYSVFRNCKNISEIFYMGQRENWRKILIGVDNELLFKSKIYFYSEMIPPQNKELFWHFVDGEPLVW